MSKARMLKMPFLLLQLSNPVKLRKPRKPLICKLFCLYGQFGKWKRNKGTITTVT